MEPSTEHVPGATPAPTALMPTIPVVPSTENDIDVAILRTIRQMVNRLKPVELACYNEGLAELGLRPENTNGFSMWDIDSSAAYLNISADTLATYVRKLPEWATAKAGRTLYVSAMIVEDLAARLSLARGSMANGRKGNLSLPPKKAEWEAEYENEHCALMGDLAQRFIAAKAKSTLQVKPSTSVSLSVEQVIKFAPPLAATEITTTEGVPAEYISAYSQIGGAAYGRNGVVLMTSTLRDTYIWVKHPDTAKYVQVLVIPIDPRKLRALRLPGLHTPPVAP